MDAGEVGRLRAPGRVARAGLPLAEAKAAVILLHGRGATAEDILSLSEELDAGRLAFLAPQSDGYAWYPNSFLEPLAKNESGIRRAFEVIDYLLAQCAAAGIPAERVFVGGFSQGACLSLEYAASHAQRYAGVLGLSGGLIGPDGTPRDYPGSLEGTPVFLGCSDVDPYIPKSRVIETASVLKALGGDVTLRFYTDAPHSVNEDEIEILRHLVRVEEASGA